MYFDASNRCQNAIYFSLVCSVFRNHWEIKLNRHQINVDALFLARQLIDYIDIFYLIVYFILYFRTESRSQQICRQCGSEVDEPKSMLLYFFHLTYISVIIWHLENYLLYLLLLLIFIHYIYIYYFYIIYFFYLFYFYFIYFFYLLLIGVMVFLNVNFFIISEVIALADQNGKAASGNQKSNQNVVFLEKWCSDWITACLSPLCRSGLLES